MKILYNFASRSRSTKLINCLDNIISLARHDNFTIALTLDINDVTVSHKQFYNILKKYGSRVIPLYGYSESKIAAINRSMYLFNDWDIVCNHSDDMVFIKEGFDLDILNAFNNYSGLVHFPDQIQNTLCTYSMMSKDYFDKFGYIYHPDFDSVYADDYQQMVAKALNKYKLVDKQILEHRHFIWGYGEKDELLMKTENPITYAKDKETFNRLSNNFYL